MRISTGQGDKGNTKLADGSEVSKADLRIELLGSLDECNGQLGICRSIISSTLVGSPQFKAATTPAHDVDAAKDETAAAKHDNMKDFDLDATSMSSISMVDRERTFRKMLLCICSLQSDFFLIGAKVANSKKTIFAPEKIHCVEKWTQATEDILPKMTNFILPGGSMLAAHLHNARAVCRRLESCYSRYAKEQKVPLAEESDAVVRVYLNRVSDLLFCLARLANIIEECEEILWSA